MVTPTQQGTTLLRFSQLMFTHRMAGDGLDFLQCLGQTVLDLTIVQREKVSCSGQVPLTQD